MPRTVLPVRVGQVWAAPATGHRFQIVSVNDQSATGLDMDAAYQLKGTHAHDNHFGFKLDAFKDGTLEFDHSETWTREELETLKGWERPRVRCRYGTGDDSFKELLGEIVPASNPWVVVYPNGPCRRNVAMQVSWGLLLEVLNDKFASPIWIWEA